MKCVANLSMGGLSNIGAYEFVGVNGASGVRKGDEGLFAQQNTITGTILLTGDISSRLSCVASANAVRR